MATGMNDWFLIFIGTLLFLMGPLNPPLYTLPNAPSLRVSFIDTLLAGSSHASGTGPLLVRFLLIPPRQSPSISSYRSTHSKIIQMLMITRDNS